MASDLLALLDTLDGLHKAATDSTRFHATKRYDFGESAYALWPELSTALRTALTPTTDGEREAREALFFADRDHAAGFRCVPEPIHRALSTALNLLAAERAKAADAARERAAIVADLRSRLDNLWALMQDHTASPETIAYYQGARETRAFLAERYESGAHTKETP